MEGEENILETIKQITLSQDKLDKEQITLRKIIQRELGIDKDPRDESTIDKINDRIDKLEQKVDEIANKPEEKPEKDVSNKSDQKEAPVNNPQETVSDKTTPESLSEENLDKKISEKINKSFKRYHKLTKNLIKSAESNNKKEKEVVKKATPVIIHSFSLKAIKTLESLFKRVFRININLSNPKFESKFNKWWILFAAALGGLLVFWDDIKKKISEINWEKVGKTIGAAFGEINDKIPWATIGSDIWKGIIWVLEFIYDQIKNGVIYLLRKMKNIALYFWEGDGDGGVIGKIKSIWKSITDGFKEIIPNWLKRLFGFEPEDPLSKLKNTLDEISKPPESASDIETNEMTGSIITATPTIPTYLAAPSETYTKATNNLTPKQNFWNDTNDTKTAFSQDKKSWESNTNPNINKPNLTYNFGAVSLDDLTKRDGDIKILPINTENDNVLIMKPNGFVDKKLDAVNNQISRLNTTLSNGLNNIGAGLYIENHTIKIAFNTLTRLLEQGADPDFINVITNLLNIFGNEVSKSLRDVTNQIQQRELPSEKSK